MSKKKTTQPEATRPSVIPIMKTQSKKKPPDAAKPAMSDTSEPTPAQVDPTNSPVAETPSTDGAKPADAKPDATPEPAPAADAKTGQKKGKAKKRSPSRRR